MDKHDIVKILMKRDHMKLDEAWELINQTQEEIDDLMAQDSCLLWEVEDVVKYNLGLEPDFIDAFLEW